jgi:hypothetical protein
MLHREGGGSAALGRGAAGVRPSACVCLLSIALFAPGIDALKLCGFARCSWKGCVLR